jgi:GTP cyclohydrolase FolE2
MIVESTGLLPTYQRRAPKFPSLFGVPANQVVRAMNDADDDLVSLPPRVRIALDRVGVKRTRVPVRIDDPFGSGTPTVATCGVTIGCPVPSNRRGLHMSRLGDALARSVRPTYPDLATYARALAGAVAAVEYGGPVSVRVRASIPYLEEVGPDSDTQSKLSLEHLSLLARVTLDADAEVESQSGMRFTHMVACPCVQKMYRHARAISPEPLPDGEAGRPAFTHSQRCVTSVLASGLREPFSVLAFLPRLDEVIVRTLNTLPRDSELAMVYRAHDTPQFVEDALRETLWALYRTLGGPDAFTLLRGWSRSQESIHDFDLSASGMLTPDEARRHDRTIAPAR